MITLRIFLIDLIAFVDREDHVRVLLPDATKGKQGTTLDPHFPVVLFDTENLDGDWNLVSGELGMSNLPGVGTIWRLDGEEIQIEGQAAQDLRRVRRNLTDLLPTRQTASDLFWVPKMAEVAPPQFAEIDPVCLENDPSEKVIGRMTLNAGSLRTAQFAKVPNGSLAAPIHPFEFKPADGGGPGSGPRRALADSLIAEIPIDGDAVTVKAVKFDGSGAREVKLSPKGRRRSVDMLVANISPLTGEDNFNSGPHFSYYYDLAKTPLPDQQRLIPHRIPAGARALPVGIDGIDEPVPAFIVRFFPTPVGTFTRQICTSVFF